MESKTKTSMDSFSLKNLRKQASPSMNLFFRLFLVLVIFFSSLAFHRYSLILAQDTVEYQELPLDLVGHLESQKQMEEAIAAGGAQPPEEVEEGQLDEPGFPEKEPESSEQGVSGAEPPSDESTLLQEPETQPAEAGQEPAPSPLQEEAEEASPADAIPSSSKDTLPADGLDVGQSGLWEDDAPKADEAEEGPLIEGELVTQGSPELQDSSLVLAQVEIAGRRTGDAISNEEALATLTGLTTSREDFRIAILEAALKEEAGNMAQAVLEEKEMADSLEALLEKKPFQGLGENIEDLVVREDVRRGLAAALESEPEIETFLETLFSQEDRQALLLQVAQAQLQSDSPALVSAEPLMLGAIRQGYEQQALNQLLAEKIGESTVSKSILLEAAAQPAPPENLTDPTRFLTVTARGQGRAISIPLDRIRFQAGSLVMSVEPMREFTPGLYQLEVQVANPITGEMQHFRQDFAWGVLAMNLDRDIYRPGEAGEISVGVLDDQGKPVCDAQVLLEVTAPNGALDSLPVENTGQCAVLDSMNTVPDYRSSYVFSQEGEYSLKLTATQANGKIRTRTMAVRVGAGADYTVQRTAATRLYPVGASEMILRVYFGRDFEGTIMETVPGDFEILEAGQGGRSQAPAEVGFSPDGTEKKISWGVQASKGQMLSLSYLYDAPDVSPEFYTMGPLESSGNLYEQRRWEIANDEPVIAADSTTDLKGHWKFNEGVGSSAADSSSYGSNGTLNNMEPADWSASFPAVTGNLSAISFNSNNENVSVPDPVDGHLDFGNTDDITLTGWFKRDTFTTTDVILAKRNSGTTADVGYFVYLPSSDQLIFEISDGADEYVLSSTALFTTSVWNHFAIVWDQDSAANTEIYINGVDNNANDTGTIANIGSVANALTLRMGAESDSGNVFNGALDDLRIYKKALSLAEIQVLAGVTTLPIVTNGNISINAGTGTGGAFKVGDQIIATWNNSAGGDNNTSLTAVTANLSGWGGSATAAMTDTAACGGTAGNNIYEACFTLASGTIDATTVNVSVTATNLAGSTTTADTSNATVDNQPPNITNNGTLTISTDNSVAGVAALNNGVSNQDKVTQSAVTLALSDSDTSSINLSTLTGQAALALATQSNVVTAGSLDSASQTFTITVTDNAGNVSTTPSDAISVDNKAPTVTTGNLSVIGATGTGGAFKNGDSATGRWDNAGGGDNNADILSVTFNLAAFRSADSAIAGTQVANLWTGTASGTLDAQGDTNNNVVAAVADDGGNLTSLTGANNYTVDTLLPTIDSITSVAGDSTAPYVDTTDDSSTAILFASSDTGTGVSACRWSVSNVAYSSMTNNCASSTSCTANLAGEGAKTVYLACIDGAGNTTSSNTQVDYTVQVPDVTPPVGTSIAPDSLRIIDNANPSFVVADGTDAESGINTSTRLLERADATYTSNTCGMFGSFSSVAISGTYPNLSDATVSGSACYKYRYSVSDNAANTTTTPETSIIVRVPLTTIAITGGNNQSYGGAGQNPIGHTLASPLQARVTDGGSNWALADEVTVDFAITSVPASPLATGQSLSAASDNTDANGYAEVSLTLGDRAGDYEVEAGSAHPSIAGLATFTGTAGNYFEVIVAESDASFFLDPLSLPQDFASPSVAVTSNAASYELHLTPDQWPLSGLDQILNWASLLGFGWSLDLGGIMAFAESLGNPASTLAYSCSGDSCQASIPVDIDLHAAIDFTTPPGTYTSEITFSGENVNY